MASTVLYMSMSIDGFITGPNESRDNALGDGGMRLHEWFQSGPGDKGKHLHTQDLSGPDREIWDEVMSTGSVLAGRGTFEPANGWNGDHHGGVPIFIFSRHEPAEEFSWPNVTYVDDLASAVEQSKNAAGDGDVLVHGALMGQWMLTRGLLDELQLHLVPVLLGEGRRLFDHLGTEQRQLETIRVSRGRDATHLRYRIRH